MAMHAWLAKSATVAGPAPDFSTTAPRASIAGSPNAATARAASRAASSTTDSAADRAGSAITLAVAAFGTG